jgi:hypothetical protein
MDSLNNEYILLKDVWQLNYWSHGLSISFAIIMKQLVGGLQGDTTFEANCVKIHI